MQGHPWNEHPDCCGGPALTEEKATARQCPWVSLWTFREAYCPNPGLGFSSSSCSGTVYTGIVSLSTSSCTWNSGLLICVLDKLINPYWTLVLHTWLETARHFIWEVPVLRPGTSLYGHMVAIPWGDRKWGVALAFPSERPKGPYKWCLIQAKATMTSCRAQSLILTANRKTKTTAECWPSLPRTDGSASVGVRLEVSSGCLHRPAHTPCTPREEPVVRFCVLMNLGRSDGSISWGLVWLKQRYQLVQPTAGG